MQKEEYKMENHRFLLNKLIGKPVCIHCGLVLLRNDATAWCVQKGCNNELHPQYTSSMKSLTAMNWS